MVYDEKVIADLAKSAMGFVNCGKGIKRLKNAVNKLPKDFDFKKFFGIGFVRIDGKVFYNPIYSRRENYISSLPFLATANWEKMRD